MNRWLVIFLVACGGPAKMAPQPTGPRARPTLAELTWLTGSWHSAMLDAMWRQVGDAIYGIALDNSGGFEVNIIDDSDGEGKPSAITLVSLEGGNHPMTFDLRVASAQELVFADPHERTVHVTKTATGWRGE